MILVASPKPRCLRRALHYTAGRRFSWAYLGRKLSEFHRAQEFLKDRGTSLNTSNLFHSAAEALRGPYLDYLYRLGGELDSLRWWVGTLSHRDCNSSRTFHQACCLRAASNLILTWTGTEPLIVVVGDEPVRRAIQSNLAQREDRMKVLRLRQRPFLASVRDALRVAAHRIVYLLRGGWCLLVARVKISDSNLPRYPATLLISPADPRTLGEDGPFLKAYFGDLADQLAKQGYSLALVPLVSREISYVEALRILSCESFPVLVPHRYLRLGDLLWTVWETLRPPPRPRVIPRLEEMDISPLLCEDLRRDWISNWPAEGLLMAALIRRWVALDITVPRIIYLYENQPWERALCWATRRLMPGTVLVAYQHARLPRFLLKYFLALGEEAIQPQPHKVLTMGSCNARLLCENGHSPARIKVGGALRQQRFLSVSRNGVKAGPTPCKPVVLVALSIEWDETEDLLDKIGEAFMGSENVQVVVKPHPRLPFRKIRARLGSQMPVHIQVSEKPLTDLLISSSVLVYGASTVCIEALALGVPAIHVRPQFITDRDPLGEARDVRLEAPRADELREKVFWLIQHRDEYIARQRERWQAVVQDMFGLVTEETYRTFVE